jgi:hypothetical protein
MQELSCRNLLSEGVEGVLGRNVYRSRDGLVVKVTSDCKEARLATYQLKNCRRELPRIEEVWAAQVHTRTNPDGVQRCFAVLREDAEDVLIANSQWFDLLLRSSTGDYREKYLVSDELILLKEAQAMHSSLKGLLSVGDIAIQNIGRTASGQLVLRDLGSCSFLAPTHVPEFDSWNPEEEEWVGKLV